MREVKIVLAHGTYFVSYVTRKKGGRYNAAGFDSKYCTIEKVKAWIAAHNLKLIGDENV